MDHPCQATLNMFPIVLQFSPEVRIELKLTLNRSNSSLLKAGLYDARLLLPSDQVMWGGKYE